MFRIIKNNTIQTALRRYNTLSKQSLQYAKARKQLIQLNQVNMGYASSSAAGGSNSLMLVASGVLLAGSGVIVYKIFPKVYNSGVKGDPENINVTEIASKEEILDNDPSEKDETLVEETTIHESATEKIEETSSPEETLTPDEVHTPEEPSPIENQAASEEMPVLEQTLVLEEPAVLEEPIVSEEENLSVPKEPTMNVEDQTVSKDTGAKEVEDKNIAEKESSEKVKDIPVSEKHADTEVDVIDKSIKDDVKALPESVPYVIIGAGTAANAASRAIKKKDPKAKILIIGEEEALPYMRPPLSKELWFSDKEDTAETLVFNSWDGKERSIFFHNKEYYVDVKELSSKEDGGISVMTGNKVTAVDAEGHSVTLSTGEKIAYNKLLIATGGKPKHHSSFNMADENLSKHVTLFRKVSDFQNLEKALKDVKSVAIVGGGFLGSELACAMAVKAKNSDMKVSQIYNEEGNMAKVLPKYLSEWTTKKVNKEGVNTISGRSVVSSECSDDKVKLTLDNGDKVEANHVIVCVGIEPNVELARSAGLEVDPVQGGFRVNAELEGRSDIWVAGDAACFYDINLGRRRVEHHDHAVVSGRLAGENMTGAKKVYKHQSMFWSDLGPEVGYEAIGLVDSTLPTVGVWAKASLEDTPKAAAEKTGEGMRSEVNEEAEAAPPATANDDIPKTTDISIEKEEYGKGVVFYMNEKKIVGILLWNIFNQMPIARRIISEGKDHNDLNATASLFKIFK